MTQFDDKKNDLSGMRQSARAVHDDTIDIERLYRDNQSWQALSEATGRAPSRKRLTEPAFDFSGKVLRGGKYTGENLAQTNFAGADLKETNFVQADLHGSDFTGADLSGADLSGANLNGAVFEGAKLRGTNFTGAKMNGVVLVDADIQDAILLNVEMDQIALDELQALVEYLAVYYPHKLNLTRMNLTMLDFSKIDLSRVNLRGVDFTGVDFTGVNIFELDLSECIISPEQIAQALGRMPTPLELKKILAPKKQKRRFKGIDFEAFFHSAGPLGVLDLTKHPGISIKDLLTYGKAIYNAVVKAPDPKDEEIMAQFHKQNDDKQEAMAREHNAEVRKVIEERKKEVLESAGAAVQAQDLLKEELEQEKRRRHQEKEEALRTAKERYKERLQAERASERAAHDRPQMSRDLER